MATRREMITRVDAQTVHRESKKKR